MSEQIIGYLDRETLEYFVSNDSPEDNIVIALGDHAWDLLHKAKGENYCIARQSINDSSLHLPLSPRELNFVIKTMIEWMKAHINEVSIDEFKFFCRCILKKRKIKW